MEFEIGDIVTTKLELFDDYYIVTGVIHDDEKLFISVPDHHNIGSVDELEIGFSRIDERWSKKSL